MAKDLFGNDIFTYKENFDRDILANMLYQYFKDINLNDLVRLFTNEFIEITEYYQLKNGMKSTCNKMSLLFNPHRLETKTKFSRCSVFDAFKNEYYSSGLARLMIHKKITYNNLYMLLQHNINTVQYVNEFPPYIMRDLCIEQQLNNNSKILDPCGGWGGRMIGASVIVNSYSCYEPSTKTYNGLKKLFEFIRKLNGDFNAEINCLPFEKADLKDNYFDFAFTSPPYYDTEEYSKEETNSLIAYNSFDKWCEMFYLPMIMKTMDSLKKNSFFVLNIGSRNYPLNNILINNFADKYEIFKGKDRLTKVKRQDKEGETFYYIKKS